jgi:hypothetical protein
VRAPTGEVNEDVVEGEGVGAGDAGSDGDDEAVTSASTNGDGPVGEVHVEDVDEEDALGVGHDNVDDLGVVAGLLDDDLPEIEELEGDLPEVALPEGGFEEEPVIEDNETGASA